MGDKLKIVWICHFSNADVRERLPLSEKKLLRTVKSLFGRKMNQVFDKSDFAPWITNLIKAFEKFNDIELHVIAPFSGLKNLKSEFEINEIYYHFYKPDLPLIHSNLPEKFHIGGKRFLQSRFFVKQFLKKIKPDLVNLIGTENPYYSITTLDIKDIPVYVSAQTVYTNPNREIYSTCLRLNWDVELKIHSKEIYYGASSRMHRDLILNNNPNAVIFKMFFPIEKPRKVEIVPKIYDFVFFAGVDKKKGVEDLIDALVIVKREKPDVVLNIVGRSSYEYMLYLKAKVEDLSLIKNVVFDDYFPVHADMHQHIVKSHFAVLPVKLDAIPSSVIEAILLNLPVITYKTTGTPYLNKNGEAILIGEIGDVNMLAYNMITFLNNPNYALKLSKNARVFVENEYNNEKLAMRLVDNYRAVLNHYHMKKEIPRDQLFSPDEFPRY